MATPADTPSDMVPSLVEMMQKLSVSVDATAPGGRALMQRVTRLVSEIGAFISFAVGQEPDAAPMTMTESPPAGSAVAQAMQLAADYEVPEAKSSAPPGGAPVYALLTFEELCKAHRLTHKFADDAKGTAKPGRVFSGIMRSRFPEMCHAGSPYTYDTVLFGEKLDEVVAALCEVGDRRTADGSRLLSDASGLLWKVDQ